VTWHLTLLSLDNAGIRRRDIVLLDPGDPLQFVKELQVWSLTARLRLGRLWEPPGELVLSLPKETRMPWWCGGLGEKNPRLPD
jgi:hypothetical protein